LAIKFEREYASNVRILRKESENMPDTLTWKLTNAPVASSRTDDIWFFDPSIGWAVNSNGHILKTEDGGDTWVRQLATQAYLRCIGFANARVGWMGTLTFLRRLFHTVDGGTNWSLVQNLPAGAPAKICGLAVVSESVVYVAGTNEPTDAPRMMKTTDGGGTWSAWDMRAHASILIDTFFLDDRRGWVVGGKADDPAPLTRDEIKPVVLFTDDGGATWVNRLVGQEGDFPFGEWGWKIQFLNDEIGFVSLENFVDAAILKTADGGRSWTRIPVVDPQGNANLEGVGFVDELQGWVGGWGDRDFQGRFSSATHDGGKTWHNANEIGKAINRFRFFGNPVTVGYASGESVYKYSADPPPAASTARLGPFIVPQREIQITQFPVAIPLRVPMGTARVTADIWDRFGRYIGCVWEETRPTPGLREFQWDGWDSNGRAIPNGSYLWRVTADTDAESGVLEVRTRPKRRLAAKLRWIRHTFRVPQANPLRALMLGVAPAPPEAEIIRIDIPDLSGFPSAVAKAEFLLNSAAEVEHALLVQYLYAAYSLKKPTDVTDPQQKAALKRWADLLLGVAREEMGHLMTVQNLLLLTGNSLNFEREDFPQIPHLYPFKMQLEPLQQSSLAKYVLAESPADATGIQDIIDQASQGAGIYVNRVGVLYALLGVVFTADGELDSNAANGDPWSVLVREIAARAFIQDPDASHWHLPDGAFQPESFPRQAADAEWSPSRAIRVLPAATRRAALDNLRDIAVQGEGPVQASTDPEGSHFQRFLAAYRGDATNPAFPTTEWQPTRNVPTNPLLEGDSADPNVIHNLKTSALARYADLRYALLLGFLEQYFHLAPEQRGFLIGWCFGEMGSLKTLSDRYLTKLPRSADPSVVAAIPFTLPNVLHLPQLSSAQWAIHVDRLNQAIALAQDVIDNHTQGDSSLRNLLMQMRAEDQDKLLLAEQGRQGSLPTVPLGRFEQVRRILNAATGFGRPSHEGNARFWNLPLNEFLSTVLEGDSIVAPPGPDRGKNSNLVKVLKGEPPFNTSIYPMPRNRPPIDPEYIEFIEKWIDDDCPES